jgi:hypothetical protein
MAILIRPDGSSKSFPYASYRDAQRELGGCFCGVPGQVDAGYLVLVLDEGRLLDEPRNTIVEILTGYPEVYGAAVVVSYQEAGEDELLHRIRKPARDAFDRRLSTLTTTAARNAP